MADLCKKLPIYKVVEADFVDGPPDVENEQLPAKRKYEHFFNSNIDPHHTHFTCKRVVLSTFFRDVFALASQIHSRNTINSNLFFNYISL